LALVLACAEMPRRRILIAAVAVIAVVASTPFAMRSSRFRSELMPSDVERDYAALGASVPDGAKIAARWGATDAYVFYAPQGRYLNVLDPVFMAVPHPDAYWAQRRMFEGSEPDIPLVAKDLLDSDFIAYAKWETPSPFAERVRHDPRLVRAYDGYNILLRIQPSEAFVTDWRGYPRMAPGIEGFVDADRVRRGAACTTFTRTLTAPARFELAPWGPTRLWLDDRLHTAITIAPRAILGRGAIIDTASARDLRIETCRAGDRSGFYLVRR
jgi:hypothetical protein